MHVSGAQPAITKVSDGEEAGVFFSPPIESTDDDPIDFVVSERKKSQQSLKRVHTLPILGTWDFVLFGAR